MQNRTKETKLPQTANVAVSAKTAKGQQRTKSSENLLQLVQNVLDKEKGEDIVTINLADKSSIADYMVIASGRSTRQVAAIAEKIVEAIKAGGFGAPKVEGKENADWVLIDASDVIVHIFRPEVRDFYQLEKFWAGDPSAAAMGANKAG